MKRRLAIVLVAGAAIFAAGCHEAPRQKLPSPARWYGSKIEVPTGYAQGTAEAVCQNGEDRGWWSAIPFAGGELLDCEGGVQEQFTR